MGEVEPSHQVMTFEKGQFRITTTCLCRNCQQSPIPEIELPTVEKWVEHVATRTGLASEKVPGQLAELQCEFLPDTYVDSVRNSHNENLFGTDAHGTKEVKFQKCLQRHDSWRASLLATLGPNGEKRLLP